MLAKVAFMQRYCLFYVGNSYIFRILTLLSCSLHISGHNTSELYLHDYKNTLFAKREKNDNCRNLVIRIEF